jgi:hypothetical protein
MEIPHRGSRPMGLPAICDEHSNPSDRFRANSRSNSYNSASSPAASVPMPIPRARDPVPPPLPPPRHLADIANGGSNGSDIASQWGNSHDHRNGCEGSMSSVVPGSSLMGSSASRRSTMDERSEYPRRQSSTSTIKSTVGADEGYASLSGTSIESNQSVPPLFTKHISRALSRVLSEPVPFYFQ